MSTNVPGRDGLVRTEILERLTKGGRAGLEPTVVAQLELGSSPSSSELQEALVDLESRGEATLWNGRWIAVSATDWVVGQVHRLERGDAILKSGLGGEGGYFIPRRNLKGASEGDLVLANRSRRGRGRRSPGRLPEATVIKVLRRRVEGLVGVIERRHGRPQLQPFDPRVSLAVRLVGADELDEGTWVVCEVEKERSSRAGPVLAVVDEVLGNLDEPGVDLLATIRHFAIPDEFPAEVEEEAGAFPEDPVPEAFATREDLRDQLTVTIDGESARDFDDAISVTKNPDGSFLLSVHIADVSNYVPEGSTLDLEAYRRGTSVYFPDRAIPMLPERLSSGLCSLRPGVPRLTLSAFMRFSAQGELVRRRFATTVIQSRHRLTYAEVRRILENPHPDDGTRYGPTLPMLREGRKLMERLLARRLGRGSIDFDLPEGDVILDLDGAAVGVRPGDRNVAHRMIEEFMIAANEAVASELEGAEMPALFRVHEEPDRQHLHELAALLEPLGVSLDLTPESLHPSVLQGVLRQVEGTPYEPFVASLVLRAMTRARYDPECKGHYALASRHYAHFTSPIRRYPDLLVHRQLKQLLGLGPSRADGDAFLKARLPTLAEHTSATETRAERAERLLLQWKVIRMLAGREGERFTGRVTGVKPYGLFLQLSELYVDGLLPLANLQDDFYEFRAERHELVGRKGRSFRLADEVDVVLQEVDVVKRRLLLALADTRE